MKWDGVAAEDAYSYLKCLDMGFKFIYCSGAAIYYRLPSTLKDHVRQSSRFFSTKEALLKYFDWKLVKKSYYLPFTTAFSVLIKFLIKNPFLFVSYGWVLFYSIIKSLIKENATHIWNVSYTTKMLK
jgi:cellulose synthase/poly-beta-1,6-N-acetylglucosamine synthase-like glycosyltransferase